MSDILTKILTTKRAEIIANKKKQPLEKLLELISQQDDPRDFLGAIQAKLALQQSAIIAEIKKASPSKGIIRENFDPIAIATSYAEAGAACLSVLTDEQYFQGSPTHLKQARSSCNLPILRKDFIIDPYQVYESRVLGADCILLIAAALDDKQMLALYSLAKELSLAVLVEVHDEAELMRALHLPAKLIGINNRNLHTFVTDLNVTLNLRNKIPVDRILVTESGINSKTDVLLMREHGVQVFLVGEIFMRDPDPGKKLTSIFNS